MTSDISNTLYVLNDNTTRVVLSNIRPRENLLTMRLVCKVWNQAATYTAKEQLIEERKRELTEKMAPFFLATGTGLGTVDFIPELTSLRNAINELSPQEIYGRLGSLIQTEELSIQGCWIHSPNGYDAFQTRSQQQVTHLTKLLSNWPELLQANPEQLTRIAHTLAHKFNLPNTLTLEEIQEKLKIIVGRFQSILNQIEHRKSDIFERAFVVLAQKPDERSIKVWMPEGGARLFPVELFNLQIQGANNALVGSKSGVTHYFPLHGKLIEVLLFSHPYFPSTEEATIQPVEWLLQRPPHEYYNPTLHGMPPK